MTFDPAKAPLRGPTKEFNPLTKICTEIQIQIDALRQSEKQVTDELQWYRSIDPIALTENLRRNEATVEGSNFIGLAAIETLLPLLSQISSVVVVFDSAIRRLLNTDDSGLQKRLGGHAKVHIVASRRMADETVLDLASASELTYVLSNDRFGDFNEKSAVKDGRIIQHEIINRNVFVHDLQLRTTYG